MGKVPLSTAVNILKWLEADAATPYRVRVDRDRAVGRSLQKHDRTPTFKQVLAWWQAVKADSNAQADAPGDRLAALINLAMGLLVLIGAVLGIAVAGTVFGYQGDQPVNLFVLLGVLVGLPLIMLIASLLLMKGRFLLPASLRDAMGVVSPGRWMGAWVERHMPLDMFETMSRQPIHATFARWQLMAFGQAFAIGYFIGVLVVAFSLIVFTDLAFGWSTSLSADATFVWRVLHAVALPWSGWLPCAVPDQALVEASQFYRLQDNAMDAARAAELGRWWPYVLMTILVYGLLPRVSLALLSQWQVSKATRRLLEEGPEITALLDRLQAPHVEFEGQPDDETADEGLETAALAQLEITQGSAVIVWNNALDHDQVSAWLAARRADNSVPIMAAEWHSTTDQREALEKIAAHPRRLIILTKGWEPPLLAFRDYLGLIRELLGDDPTIVVVPLDISGGEINPRDRDVWAHALAEFEDPKLYVASAT